MILDETYNGLLYLGNIFEHVQKLVKNRGF